MSNHINLIIEAKRLIPDLGDLEERLDSEPNEILAQAFPPVEPTLKTRSIIWPGLKSTEFDVLESAVNDTRKRVLTLAKQALHKIQGQGENVTLEPEEALGLESVILMEARPALLVQGGQLASVPRAWKILDEVRNSVERVCRSVGRIELGAQSDLDFVGTGFLVADDVIMTNRHVAMFFCQSRGNGAWAFAQDYQPSIDYLHEWGVSSSARFEITEVIGIHEAPEIDLALLRISRMSDDKREVPLPLRVASAYDADVKAQKVYAIGYPFRREGDPEILYRIFGDIYGFKRVQPGEIIDVNREKYLLRHDCSTLGGNSGSCLIDLESGLVIALHFGGRYRQYNRSVPLWLLHNDPLLKKANINFD